MYKAWLQLHFFLECIANLFSFYWIFKLCCGVCNNFWRKKQAHKNLVLLKAYIRCLWILLLSFVRGPVVSTSVDKRHTFCAKEMTWRCKKIQLISFLYIIKMKATKTSIHERLLFEGQQYMRLIGRISNLSRSITFKFQSPSPSSYFGS